MAEPVLMRGWTNPITFSGPPPTIPAEQLALFPRKTLFELPMPEGKDVSAYVQADNGRKYYLKIDKGDKCIRANEWLSHQIAGMVGISTPRCDFIQTNNGDIAFGSESVDGVFNQTETILFLEKYSMIELGSAAPELRAVLSAIHALDLFLNNIDRHMGNFLIAGAGNERQLMALDFARSVFWRWPWDGFFQDGDTSAREWIDLRQRHGFDIEAALLIVRRLGVISPAQIRRMVGQMPTHWLPLSLSDDLFAYCDGGGWADRVEQLRKGLTDGSIV
jgi:hypothetical protein